MFEGVSLLAELEEDDVEWILETGQERRVRAHTAITEEGVRPEALYFVLQGLLEVAVASGGGRRLATLGPGELIGEVSLLEDRPASATVKAVEPTLLLAIPRNALTVKLAAESRFAARWYRAFALLLARRLRERVLDLTQQLGRVQGAGDPYAAAWQPLEEAMEDLKASLTEADEEAIKTGSISDVSAQRIEQGLTGFTLMMNERLGERSGLDEHVRDELGGRIKTDLLPYLLLTASAERMYSKPRGYTGDFMSIEVIYQNQPRGSSRLGPLLDRCFHNLPAPQAVRNRRGLLADEIRRTCRSVPGGEVQITSLACGPAQEVFDVLEEASLASRLRATLIDIDPEALVFVENLAQIAACWTI